MAIIERIARERRVEKMVEAHCRPFRAEHRDLAQMIYLALLQTPEEEIVRAWEEGWINYKIAKILTNYYDFKRSAYNNLFAAYSRRATEIDDGTRAIADDTEHRRSRTDIPRHGS